MLRDRPSGRSTQQRSPVQPLRCTCRARPLGRLAQQKKRVSSLNFVSYSCCKCHDGGTTDLHGSCHEAGKLASSTESRAHAVLLLDRVAVRAWRSPTAEIDIVSSMDHHHHGHAAADRAIGE